MVLNVYKFLQNLTEDKLFQLLKKRYPDLINLNEEEEFSPIDWYIPSTNTYIEGKCRKEDYPTLFVEKHKWNVMKNVENCWYINSTPRGIYVYIINEIEEPLFRNRIMEKSQLYKGKGQYVHKEVGELLLNECSFQLDHLLLQ